MRNRLNARQLDPVSHLVVSIDPDTDANGAGTATGLRGKDVEREVCAIDPSARRNAAGDVILDQGATTVFLVRWEASDVQLAGVPLKQCLERLVCAALVAAYPNRGPAVEQWLEGRPDPPPAKAKEFAWSHMAGWYADRGCEAFYRALWSDERVASELKSRLTSSGAWRIGDALVS
jgi:hypothetical protein